MKTTSARGLVLACLFVLGIAATANAGAIPLVDIGNDPNYSWTWDQNWMLGYDFTVGAGGVTFNALGVFDTVSANRDVTSTSTVHTNAPGLNASHQVGVWDSLGNLLTSTTVNPGDPTAASANSYGRWVYSTVPQMTLAAGSYTIGAYYAGNSDPVMVQQTAFANGNANYVLGQWQLTSNFEEPVNPYAPNEQQYFGPTLLAVPDGGLTLTLLGGAMFALGALRRKLN